MVNYKKEYPDGLNISFWNYYIVPAIRRIKGDKCELCGSCKFLDIHHKDYEKEVNINTLILVCRSCHKKIHKKKYP